MSGQGYLDSKSLDSLYREGIKQSQPKFQRGFPSPAKAPFSVQMCGRTRTGWFSSNETYQEVSLDWMKNDADSLGIATHAGAAFPTVHLSGEQEGIRESRGRKGSSLVPWQGDHGDEDMTRWAEGGTGPVATGKLVGASPLLLAMLDNFRDPCLDRMLERLDSILTESTTYSRNSAMMRHQVHTSCSTIDSEGQNNVHTVGMCSLRLAALRTHSWNVNA